MVREPGGEPASARERLLDAASDLFYEGGVQSVGVDRVVERAGVAKATLYSVYGNKDGLVRAYLTAHDEEFANTDPRAGHRTTLGRDFWCVRGQGSGCRTGFRGCAFARQR
jgi:AcrR family transcriptional regulator